MFSWSARAPAPVIWAAFALTLAGCTSASQSSNFQFVSANDLPANIRAPMAIKTVAPYFPYAARTADLDGDALVQCLVSETGVVQDASVLSASDYEFGETALAALSKWQFAPGMRDGQPAAIRIAVPFRFSVGKPTEPARDDRMVSR